MFENLYEDSVRYDDNLLQAACVLQAEFDLTSQRDYAIIRRSEAFKQALGEVAEEYRVEKSALRARIREILEEG